MKIPNHPFTKIGKKLESACRKAIFDFSLLQNANSISIALSGGKDSLTLLFLLNAILGRGFDKKKLYAIHVNGTFSCGASTDEKYIKEVCKKLKIDLFICENKSEQKKLNCYSCSRERRRLIFNKAKELNADTIAFGHHRDDNIQTFLLNLFHKAEVCPMRPKTVMKKQKVTIIRPLIYIKEKDIIEFSKLYEFRRIMCKCPIANKSKRMEVKKTLEDIKKIFPNAKKNITIASNRQNLENLQ